MTFERIGSTLTSQSVIDSAAIDIINGFAYFTSYDTTTVSKVSLSSFTEVATISHGGANYTGHSSVIDTTNGFLYIGAYSIQKIRLSDFTVVYSIADDWPHQPHSAVIDTVNGFAYFGSSQWPAKVYRINLSDFTRTFITPGGNNFACAVIDTVNGFAYFGTNTATGSIVKIRLSDFSYVATLNTMANNLRAAVLDEVNGFAYFASYANQKISKIRLSDFIEVAVLDTAGITEFRSAVIDSASGFAYFGNEIEPANIVKVRLSDFTIAETITFPTGENNADGAVIDAANGFMYFGVQGNVVKVYDSDLLPPLPGNLTINITPSDAVYNVIDSLGNTVASNVLSGTTVSNLAPGIYSSTLSRTGYQDKLLSNIVIGPGESKILTDTLILLPCPVSPKYSGNTITLNATPKDGIGPYYVEFFKDGVTIDPLRLIDELGNPTTNPILSAPENTLITRVYTLDDLDIASALTGTIDFSVFISDSCPTGAKSCTDVCTINIGCVAPVCNFQVT